MSPDMRFKGQVTMYLILGISLLILIVIGIYLFSGSKTISRAPTEMTIDLSLLQQDMKYCLKSTTEEGIIYNSRQGGYYHVPSPRMITLSHDIPFYFYQERFLVPPLNVTESELCSYIIDHFSRCMNNYHESKLEGFTVTENTPSCTAKFSAEKVNIFFTPNLKVSKATTIRTTQPVFVEMETRFAQLHKIALKLNLDLVLTPGKICMSCIGEELRAQNFKMTFENIREGAILVNLYDVSAFTKGEGYQYQFVLDPQPK